MSMLYFLLTLPALCPWQVLQALRGGHVLLITHVGALVPVGWDSVGVVLRPSCVEVCHVAERYLAGQQRCSYVGKQALWQEHQPHGKHVCHIQCNRYETHTCMHVCFNMTVPLRFAGSLRVDMCTLATFGCTVGFVGLVEYKTNEPLFGGGRLNICQMCWRFNSQFICLVSTPSTSTATMQALGSSSWSHQNKVAHQTCFSGLCAWRYVTVMRSFTTTVQDFLFWI